MPNHILYFDNLYTSLHLEYFLAKKGIYTVGTVPEKWITNINCRLKRFHKEIVYANKGTTKDSKRGRPSPISIKRELHSKM